MASYNNKTEISNGTTTDTFHPETNTGQVYDNNAWLNFLIGKLSNLTTTQKMSLVAALNEIDDSKDDKNTLNTHKSMMAANSQLGHVKPDGTTVMTDSFGTSSIRTYETVSAMKLDTTLIDNDLVFTLGYRSIGDGGGATYRISTSSDPEDGGSIFVLNNNKRALLVGDSKDIHVKQFGAYGDGTTNDEPYINNAITFLYNQDGGRLHFDGSTYAISSSILLKGHVTLLGVVNKTTILTITNTFDAFILDSITIKPEINGFIVKATGGINETSRNSAVYIGRDKYVRGFKIRNVTFDSFCNGIDSRNYWKYSLVESVHIINCRTGINVEQTSSENVSTVTFLNILIENPTYRHFKLKYVDGFAFIGCRFQGDFTSGYSLDAIGCFGVSFLNCRFDGMDSIFDDYAMLSCSEGGLITFNNCYFIDYASTGTNSSLFESLTGGKISLNNCAFEEIDSSRFNYTFRVDSTSRITYSNCAKMTSLPPNTIATGGVLIDLDSVEMNRKITISSSSPTGGNDGDIWMKY